MHLRHLSPNAQSARRSNCGTSERNTSTLAIRGRFEPADHSTCSFQSRDAVAMDDTTSTSSLGAVFDDHVRSEFVLKDADAAVATMTDDAYLNHVPVATGA